MTDKNWSQIGDEIEDMVRKALESRDFGKLSQDLSRTVGEAMENVGKSVQDAVNKANDKTREATERYSDRADRTADAHSRTEKSTDRPVYSGTVEGKGTSSSGQTSYEYSRSTMRSTRFQPGYEQAREKKGKNFLRERFKNPGGLTGTGMALAICGYTFLGILVIALGITLPIVLPRNLQAAMITTGVLAPFVAGSAFMAYKGTSLLGQSRRFRRYVEALREREFCQIQELADDIENTLMGLGEREVESKQIGNMVMDRLKEVDEVAYVRFASVYRQFKDINTFIDELKSCLWKRRRDDFMAEVQTKALFTCTEAGYDAALSIMELYRKNGMQAFFYGIAEEADLVSLGEINKMTHVLHFVDEESIRLVSIADEMGGFTVDISINDLILPK